MCYVPSGGSADRCPPNRNISALIGGSSVYIDGTEINLKEGGAIHPSRQDSIDANCVRIRICGILWGSRASTQIPQHVFHEITASLSHRLLGCSWGILILNGFSLEIILCAW